MIYHAILVAHGAAADTRWWDLNPESVKTLGGGVVLYWDKKWDANSAETLFPLKHRKPDLVLITPDEIITIEIGCSADHNVAETQEWRFTKYSPLADQLTIAHTKPVRVVPIVVGHTGVITRDLARNIESLGIKGPIAKLQETVAVESVRIIYSLLGKSQRR